MATSIPEPYLNPAAAAPPANRRHVCPWLYPVLSFIPTAINFVACLSRGGGDCGTYAFTFAVGVGVLLLLGLVRMALLAPPGSAARRRLKLAFWAVDTAVVFAIIGWVTKLPPMPLLLAAPLWAMGVAGSAFVLSMCARRD